MSSDNDNTIEREFLLRQAIKEIALLRAMKEIAEKDENSIAILKISGVKHAFSTAGIFIPLIDNEITEIEKAINGEPNKWE